MQSEKIKKA